MTLDETSCRSGDAGWRGKSDAPYRPGERSRRLRPVPCPPPSAAGACRRLRRLPAQPRRRRSRRASRRRAAAASRSPSTSARRPAPPPRGSRQASAAIAWCGLRRRLRRRPAYPSSATRRRFRSADASFDLAVSLLALQSVNDLPGALVQVRRALKARRPVPRLRARRRDLDRAAPGLRRRRGGGRRRRQPARRALRRCARFRRAAAAGGFRPAGDGRRERRGALRRSVRADARPARHGARPMRSPSAAARRCAARRCCGRPRSMPSASPTATAACAPPSRSSGCRAGRRMRASRSRCGRARPRPGSPTRSALPSRASARRPAADGFGARRFRPIVPTNRSAR